MPFDFYLNITTEDLVEGMKLFYDFVGVTYNEDELSPERRIDKNIYTIKK